MLQSLMRKLLLEKCEEKDRSSGESLDDIEVILRRNKQQRGRQRKRVTSCPDPTRLKEIHCEDSLNMFELRRTREGKEQLLIDHSVQGYQTIQGFNTGYQTEEESAISDGTSINFLNDTLEMEYESSTERATVERLAAHFDSCVEQAVSLVLSLPDGDFKQDLLHSLEYQLGKLKQAVTENCHSVIFSMLVKVKDT